MARCGNCGGSCGCQVIAGQSAIVRGTGSATDPYRVDLIPLALVVQNSGTVELELTGSGTEEDPFVITANLTGTEIDGKWSQWEGTQVEYDALGSWDDGTLYLVTG